MMKKNKNIMVRAVFAISILLVMLSTVFADVVIQAASTASTTAAASANSESAPIVIVDSTTKISRYTYVNVGDKFELIQGQSAIVQDEGNINIALTNVEYIYSILDSSTSMPAVNSATDSASNYNKAYVGIKVTKPSVLEIKQGTSNAVSAADVAPNTVPSTSPSVIMPSYNYEYKLFPGESVVVYGGLKITLLGISDNKAAFYISSASTMIVPPTSTTVSVKLGELFKLNEEQTANVVDAGLSISLKDIQEGYRCPKTTLIAPSTTTVAANSNSVTSTSSVAANNNVASATAMPIHDDSIGQINCYDALATLKVNQNTNVDSVNNLEMVYTVKLGSSINVGQYTITFKDYSGNTGVFIAEKNTPETLKFVVLGEKFEMQFGDKVALENPTYIELGFININKVQSKTPVSTLDTPNSILSTTSTTNSAEAAEPKLIHTVTSLADTFGRLKVVVTDKNVLCAQNINAVQSDSTSSTGGQFPGVSCGIIKDATVVLENENGEIIGKESTSAGAAVFNELNEGLYIVKVYADGYVDTKSETKVRAGQGEYLYASLQSNHEIDYYYNAVISVSLPPESMSALKYRITTMAKGDIISLYGNVGLTLLSLDAEKNVAVFSFVKLSATTTLSGSSAGTSSETSIGVVSSSEEIGKENLMATSTGSDKVKSNSLSLDENACSPIGIRSKEADGNAVYCNLDGQAAEQKQKGIECQNNFECQSNSCMSSQCADLNKKLDENLSLMNKLVAWLKNIFG